MAGPLTAQEIDAAVAGGHLDPILGNAMKAKMVPAGINPAMAAPGVGNPLMSPGAPVPPVDNVSMVLGPKATPPPAPAPVDPGPLAVFPHLAPKPQPAGPPPGPPSPAPAPAAPIGPAHKAGSALLGPAAAPAGDVDWGNFGKHKPTIDSEKQEIKHQTAQKGYQAQLSKVEADQAEAFAETADSMVADADARARKLEAAAMRRRQFLDTYNAKTEKAIDDFAKAEIDPNRAFAKAGNGSLFVSMIGVALSGVGQMFKARAGMDPGRNGAMDQIEKMIAQDIDLQKAQIAKKGAGIDARKGLYASYLQQFGSEDAAEAMAYEGYLRKAKATVDAQMAKTTSKEVKIRGAALGEALDNRIEQFKFARAEVGYSLHDQFVARQQAAAAAAAASDKAERKAARDAILKATLERYVKNGGIVKFAGAPIEIAPGVVIDQGSPLLYNGKGELDLAGTESAAKGPVAVNLPVTNSIGKTGTKVVYAADPESKKKIQGAAVSVTNYKSGIERMVAAAKMPGPWYVPGYGSTEKALAYDSAAADALGAYKDMHQLGVLDKGVEKVVGQVLVPTPKVYIKDNEIKKLELAGQAADKVLDSTVKVYGVPVDNQPTPYVAPSDK